MPPTSPTCLRSKKRSAPFRFLIASAMLTVVVGFTVSCSGYPLPDGSGFQATPTPEETTLPDAAAKRQAAARQVLADRLTVTPDSLEFVSEQEVQWSDTSLGCPEPDQAYATVIVPGFRLTFRHSGNQYEVHAAEDASYHPVSCEGENRNDGSEARSG